MGRAHGDLVDLWCSPRPCLVCLAGGHAAVCHLVVSAPQFGASQHAFWFGAGPGACATRHSLSHLQWPAGTHGGHGYPLPGRWHMWLDGWATACSLARTGRGDGGDGAAAAAVCAHYYQNTTDPDSGTDARTVCVVIRGSSGAGADRRRFGGDDPVGGNRRQAARLRRLEEAGAREAARSARGRAGRDGLGGDDCDDHLEGDTAGTSGPLPWWRQKDAPSGAVDVPSALDGITAMLGPASASTEGSFETPIEGAHASSIRGTAAGHTAAVIGGAGMPVSARPAPGGLTGVHNDLQRAEAVLHGLSDLPDRSRTGLRGDDGGATSMLEVFDPQTGVGNILPAAAAGVGGVGSGISVE